jgi:ubiquinone/menaquinone biosynthesis C-methylase UbiE
LGVGTGVNLPLYPADVELTAIDLSPRMLEVARERALRLRLRVDLIVGDARDLPFADEVFETVTATHFFSAVPDPDVAIAEAIRVLRRGGRLLILDHIASDNRPVRFLQRALGPLLARVTGWNMNSEPSETVSARGLVIERRRRSRRGMLEELVARKPA